MMSTAETRGTAGDRYELVVANGLVVNSSGSRPGNVLVRGLTTVEQPIAALASAAVDALLSRSREGTREPREVRLKPKLVVRGSTSRHPIRD